MQIVLRVTGYHLREYYPRAFIGFLKKYYSGEKDLIGVEIGVYKGINTLNIFKYLPIKRLYLIDPYENSSDYIKSGDCKSDQGVLDNAKIEAQKRLSKFKKKIVWINEFSDTAYKKIPEKLDFVYIDGNHNYENVKRDMENYYSLLKKESILAGHDIDSFRHTGVLFAFADFIKEKRLPYRIMNADWIIVNISTDTYSQRVRERPILNEFMCSSAY